MYYFFNICQRIVDVKLGTEKRLFYQFAKVCIIVFLGWRKKFLEMTNQTPYTPLRIFPSCRSNTLFSGKILGRYKVNSLALLLLVQQWTKNKTKYPNSDRGHKREYEQKKWTRNSLIGPDIELHLHLDGHYTSGRKMLDGNCRVNNSLKIELGCLFYM